MAINISTVSMIHNGMITEYWAKSAIDTNKWMRISTVKINNQSLMYIDGILQSDKMITVEEETYTTQAGHEYYSVYVNGRVIYGDYNIWNDMISWATETFGPTPNDGIWTSGARWYVNNARFWFKDKKDLEWFVLRWS